MEADIKAAKDRGEVVSLMDPLLIGGRFPSPRRPETCTGLGAEVYRVQAQSPAESATLSC